MVNRYRHSPKIVRSCLILSAEVSILLFSTHFAFSAENNRVKQWHAPEPDITSPGPDTPNFPNSPFTLPPGRAYLENFPFYLNLKSCNVPLSYQWPYLLRVGVLRDLEFRLTGQGLSAVKSTNDQRAIVEFTPVAIGMKVHLWGTPDMLYCPSGGFDCYIELPFFAKTVEEAPQFIANGLFMHHFPGDCHLEWNVGFFTKQFLGHHKREIYFSLEWALQKEILPQLELFVENAYYRSKIKRNETLLLGVGFLATFSKRFCFYGSYNFSLVRSGQDLANLGFAVAF